MSTTTVSNSSSNVRKATTTTTSGEHKTECSEKEASDLELECGRERLKKHRVEVAGRVWIPDIWSQDDLLKDWLDCSVFDASLAPKGLMSAREALANQQNQHRSPATAAATGLEVGTSSC